MKKYLDHLETTNNNMKTLYESENPAREPSNNCNIHLISKCNEEIDSRYCILDFDLANREVFDFVDLNLYISNDSIKKHNFICDIQLSVPTGLYRYPHAPDTEETSEYYETLKAQIITRINDTIPIYCTRQMRKNYSLIRNLSKPVLRMLYHDLTGDASLSNDQISKEIEERLRFIILLEDPSIIIDLRTNNGFQGSKFDIFWDELDGYFNEALIYAILYIPYVISIQKLRERIITHLNTKYQGLPLPSNISIPSKEGIRLNFAPSNAYITKAMQYTERFNVKYKMQSRLLQKSSENEHYCHMIFKYEREFNIKYQDYAYFISADDKHKVPIGEDIPVSTGVHNKKTLAPAEGEITAADHNFTKLS
ncbi:hypothetical protein RhiirA1_472800 [Rhizophagus irregularis]|nr:hypothetical protein RhiirA1_472800 [Rhizophagus irregularis]PKY23366.1 hypothetical protein RhiirB3_437558 [Rhizophagus irregularis]